MGSCVSTHQKPSAMKLQMLFKSNHNNNDTKQTPIPIINADLATAKSTSFHDFGSQEETFFDSQAWLDSDCDDDFMSVNGEFTPSRGNTPVHHNFTASNNKPPVLTNQLSINDPDKKMRLSDLFNESERGNYVSDFEEDDEKSHKNENNSKMQNHGEETPNHGKVLKSKRERFGRSVQNCFPTLLSSRSSSTNGRKMMSPGPSPSPNPVMVN